MDRFRQAGQKSDWPDRKFNLLITENEFGNVRSLQSKQHSMLNWSNSAFDCGNPSCDIVPVPFRLSTATGVKNPTHTPTRSE